MTITLNMNRAGGVMMPLVRVWNKKSDIFSSVYLVFDTGASVTVLSEEDIIRTGYALSSDNGEAITTASGIERVKSVRIEKMEIGGYTLFDIPVYVHKFPQESWLASGVLGMDVISRFDVNLLFSKSLIELTAL